MGGEVLEKNRAREIYESYKRTRQDPGLLEQKDYKTFEMRIFPIPSGTDQKVEITYYQELEYDHDWATYVYPLATTTTGAAESRTTGKFAVHFDIKSAVPITAVESPSHGKEFVIAKHSDGYSEASLEASGGSLNRDVVLAYRLSRPHTGVDLITSKTPGEDGYFCLSITAGEDLGKQDQGADYVFVLDISGSMATDGKLLLSKDSIGAFINELGEEDRFEVITFNVQPYLAFSGLRPAQGTAKQQALEFLASQQARGGTILNSAITTAYKYAAADRPLYVVILSDGLTEQQERRTLLELIRSRPRNARVFCVGVGNDVNRPLLEQLAQDSGGMASFLSQGDNFSRQDMAFLQKLMSHVAADLIIEFAVIKAFEIEPKQVPNLFYGSPVRIYGRYRGQGAGEIMIRGNVNGREWKQSVALEFPKEDAANPEIDRMWASRRVDNLLKEADRSGERSRVADVVIQLGETYSILTEYTSFLVLENDSEFQRWKIARRNTDRLGRDRESEARWQAQLDQIRKKAIAGLGPEPVLAAAAPSGPAKNIAAPVFARSTNPEPAPVNQGNQIISAPVPQQSRNFSVGGGGSGPVGPLFVALALGLSQLKRRLS